MSKEKKGQTQNTTQKSKDRVTGTPLESEVYSGAQERQVVPAPHMVPVAC